jgi:hypothetical protein
MADVRCPTFRQSRERSSLRFDDARAIGNELLSQLHAPESILSGRIINIGGRPRPTLGKIAGELGITREGVRQLQIRTTKRLRRLLTDPKFAPLNDYAIELQDALGTATPVQQASEQLGVSFRPSHQVDLGSELLLFLAGYRVDGSWLLRTNTNVQTSVGDVVEDALAGDVLSIQELDEVWAMLGIPERSRRPVLESLPNIHVIGDSVMPWGRGIGDKCEALLKYFGEPKSARDLSDAVPQSHALGTLKNALARDPRFQRVGKDKWALSSWGGDPYPGVFPALVAELERKGGDASINALARILHEKFGIPRASVLIMAGTSPFLVQEGTRVRFRTSDEKFIPDRTLATSRGCFKLDDGWSLQIPVTYDIVRGSGTLIPQAFAIYVGVKPGERRTFFWNDREISIAWHNQNPSISSLRSVAEDLAAGEGDVLVAQPEKSNSFRFSSIKQIDLREKNPSERMKLLIGNPESSVLPIAALASAIGLSNEASIAEVRQRLRRRRDPKLGQALEIYLRWTLGETP